MQGDARNDECSLVFVGDSRAKRGHTGPVQQDDRLFRHLEDWLGSWPPARGKVTIVGSVRREQPGWNGRARPVAGIQTPEGTVLSVPPSTVGAVQALGDDVETIAAGLAGALGLDGWRFVSGVFRWSDDPAPTDHPGTWVPPHDPRIPSWLQPFNADVLVAFTGDGVAAGVGRKVHNAWGHELAVVTEPGHRGKGWARRLVAQAAHRVLESGAIPTYLHSPTNAASARTADASGFPDRGWRILGLFDTAPS